MNKILDVGLKILGYRNGLSPKINNFLDKIGNEKITSIIIVRQPLQKIIDVLLNAISFGDYNKNKERLKYDSYYHLKLLINGKYVLEKNERINIEYYKKVKNEQQMNVKLLNNNMNIDELFSKTLNNMGERLFYNYDAFKNNCQIFVLNLLKSLGVNNIEYNKFVKQNVDELIKNNPILPPVSKTITDIASSANILINGGSIKRNSWIEHVKNYSKKNNINYKNAMTNPDCKLCYVKY